LSPLEPPAFFGNLKDLAALKRLSEVLHCGILRFLGGEPLLNPGLAELIGEVRKTGITDTLSISTNGTLLQRAGADIWSQLDMAEVSIYGFEDRYIKQTIDEALEISRKFQTELYVYHFETFRQPYSEICDSDDALTTAIYNTCLTARSWHCFNLWDKHFYKCPQARAIERHLFGEDVYSSGIPVLENSRDLAADLQAYIDNDSPLPACSYCLGTVGKRFLPEQVRKSRWKDFQRTCRKDAIDRVFMDEVWQRSAENTDDILTVRRTDIIKNGNIISL
jgi:hypothetical protein